jgi:hypothetical protein
VVEYQQGTLNVVADALSHQHEDSMGVHVISSPSFVVYDALRAEMLSSPEALQWRAELAANTAPPCWTEVDDLLPFKGRVLLPAASSLEQAHTMGHEGCEKTLHRFWAMFYSPHARQREFMICCLVCQKNKTEHLHPAGLLQPLPVPSQIWSDIAMDFIEGFLKVGGKSVILTVVDRFSKFTHFIPLSHPYSANSVAKAFFDHTVHLHRMPCSITSHRDPVFTSMFWKEIFQLAGVSLRFSSAFHPQTDGQSEVANRTIAMYL